MDDELEDVRRRDAMAWLEAAEARLSSATDRELADVVPDPSDEEFIRSRLTDLGDDDEAVLDPRPEAEADRARGDNGAATRATDPEPPRAEPAVESPALAPSEEPAMAVDEAVPVDLPVDLSVDEQVPAASAAGQEVTTNPFAERSPEPATTAETPNHLARLDALLHADMDELRLRGLIDTATISVGAVSPSQAEEFDWFEQIWGKSTEDGDLHAGGSSDHSAESVVPPRAAPVPQDARTTRTTVDQAIPEHEASDREVPDRGVSDDTGSDDTGSDGTASDGTGHDVAGSDDGASEPTERGNAGSVGAEAVDHEHTIVVGAAEQTMVVKPAGRRPAAAPAPAAAVDPSPFAQARDLAAQPSPFSSTGPASAGLDLDELWPQEEPAPTTGAVESSQERVPRLATAMPSAQVPEAHEPDHEAAHRAPAAHQSDRRGATTAAAAGRPRVAPTTQPPVDSVGRRGSATNVDRAEPAEADRAAAVREREPGGGLRESDAGDGDGDVEKRGGVAALLAGVRTRLSPTSTPPPSTPAPSVGTAPTDAGPVDDDATISDDGSNDLLRARICQQWLPALGFAASFILALGAVLVAMGSKPGWLFSLVKPLGQVLVLGAGSSSRPASLLVVWVIGSLLWLVVALVAPYLARSSDTFEERV